MQGDFAHASLGGIIRQTDAVVVKEGHEEGPALEHVVHDLGDVVPARELGALLSHPGLQIGEERRAETRRRALRFSALCPLIVGLRSNRAFRSGGPLPAPGARLAPASCPELCDGRSFAVEKNGRRSGVDPTDRFEDRPGEGPGSYSLP